MSFLNTTATMSMRTVLPPHTTFAAAISVLRNHTLLIKFDPEFASFEVLPAPADANPATKFYRVTDHMEALPRGLWDTTVSFTAEMTDIEHGIEWLIRAPLGLVQETFWTIEPLVDGEEGGEWVLQELVTLKCSRLLVGTVRSKIEHNWRGIHAKFIANLPNGKDGEEPKVVVAAAE